MQSVVITGADGFLGSHLVRHFAQNDVAVYALTLPDSPTVHRLAGMEHVTVLSLRLEEWESSKHLLPLSPMAFIHLAWAGVSPEQRSITALQMQNIALCTTAVEFASYLQAQRFILPGSTAEYAYCNQLINETACPSPQNAYGAAKIATRFLCACMCEERKLPYVYAVISGIYASDRQDNNVIFYTISQLLQGKRPALTRLEQLWDYVHISDVERAFFGIASKGRNGAFYSIGHGDNWPLYKYIYQIRDIIDASLPLGIGEVPYKDSKLPSSCVDLTTLKEDTGFVPTIPFHEGIAEVIAQVRKQMEHKERK